ncbi:uncharacterized protein TRIREDRAFT_111955 [Trichoderma reesei QM6a]|uniref:Predicted protein n=2 Tax=Hypocrea jecorina TaxID=51453 RepID=G0RVU4_HYPJQ|nr:uncharacterized protein TRIREDRAFT_111955 [Trichoderma reesei QM6a]EGR44730.1 predicted protein [Trichoderma reesei QM6a]ETR97556.1 hypothetical protein M419DRAFT_91219 [Trichoderma reesei RUT C-30]
MAIISKFFSRPLLALLVTQSSALCFYPDGTPAPGDVPCTDSTANSVCCGTGYACLSNGICQATGDELKKPGATEFVRGSCTDKTFRSSSCPSFCGTPGQDNVGGGEGMAKCDNTKQDLYWCINAANIALQEKEDPCSDQDAVVFFPGTPTVLTTINVAPKPTSTSTSTSTTSTPTTMATSTSSSSASPTRTGSPDTATSTSTPTSQAETSPTTEQKKSSNAGVIGGAVGGSLGGIAVIGILAFIFLRRRRGGSSKATVHEMDYTPVEPKPSPSVVVDPMQAYGGGVVHEVPGSYYAPPKEQRQEPPMELPA